MNGLTKGEQSTAALPILQLFVRSGELLTDFYSATYKIEDVHDLSANPVSRVAETPFVSATHKLSTGRYWVPTGDTSTWSYGTHRVVCTYLLAAGGPSYTQVIEFELLKATDWPTGRGYVGYASTARLLSDGFVGSTVAPETLHRDINRISRQVEGWTHRFFEPRYRAVRIDGPPESVVLPLPLPIIALEQVQAIWTASDGSEETYDHDNSLVRVYNRHLDGQISPDDRDYPKLVRDDSQAWSTGRYSLKVTGVFGYTEPSFAYGDERTGVGSTPDVLTQVVGALLYRYRLDPTLSNPTLQQPGSIKQMKTRDQSVTFATNSTEGIISFMSGDVTIDRILVKLSRGPAVAYAGRRFGEQEVVDDHEENFET